MVINRVKINVQMCMYERIALNVNSLKLVWRGRGRVCWIEHVMFIKNIFLIIYIYLLPPMFPWPPVASPYGPAVTTSENQLLIAVLWILQTSGHKQSHGEASLACLTGVSWLIVFCSPDVSRLITPLLLIIDDLYYLY